MARGRIAAAVVRTCSFIVLEGETGHLPLHIFNHFAALHVSGHYKITALLLHIRYCVLKSNIKLQPLVDVVLNFSELRYASLNLLVTFLTRCFVIFKIKDGRKVLVLCLDLQQ